MEEKPYSKIYLYIAKITGKPMQEGFTRQTYGDAFPLYASSLFTATYKDDIDPIGQDEGFNFGMDIKSNENFCLVLKAYENQTGEYVYRTYIHIEQKQNRNIVVKRIISRDEFNNSVLYRSSLSMHDIETIPNTNKKEKDFLWVTLNRYRNDINVRLKKNSAPYNVTVDVHCPLLSEREYLWNIAQDPTFKGLPGLSKSSALIGYLRHKKSPPSYLKLLPVDIANYLKAVLEKNE